VQYEAPGWGVGELLLEGETLLWHELPVPKAGGRLARPRPPLAERLGAYFAGEPEEFDDIRVDTSGMTGFQQALTKALRAVPRGEIVSYGELAALAGRPAAARAAGTFCARNHVPIVVPCHRVVAANGLGSYGSLGLSYKRRLLALERAAL
jgi:methylated-DNA-[protein]-cysteine S-methyltransferase